MLDVIRAPIVLSPMAGGPSTPTLCGRRSRSGARWRFWPPAINQRRRWTRKFWTFEARRVAPSALTSSFPVRQRKTRPALARYLTSIEGDASRLGTSLGDATWDDDDWNEKIFSLIARPVDVVSFTFGCPSREIIEALQRSGSLVVVTVTNVGEAELCAAREGSMLSAYRGVRLVLIGERSRTVTIPVAITIS